MKPVDLAGSPKDEIAVMKHMGYNFSTALADVIDNSISANASSVRISASLDSDNMWIRITDDGDGLTEDELITAMKWTSKSLLDERKTSDLGRFGKGLKSASFSQCNRLTLISSKNHCINAVRWDVDHIKSVDKFEGHLLEDSDIKQICDKDDIGKNGTQVLWELLEINNYDEFQQEIEDASNHLELVFHRYLDPGEYEEDSRKVEIMINKEPLKAFDPFYRDNLATVPTDTETMGQTDKKIMFKVWTIPHEKRINTEVYQRNEKRLPHLENQGFYIYRNKRLIIWGDWFGLIAKKAITQLTRVQVDIPNTVDIEWKIEIKKETAMPPPAVKKRFRKIINNMTGVSKKVSGQKGVRRFTDEKDPLFVQERKHDKKVTWYFNQENPVIRNMRELMKGNEVLTKEFSKFSKFTEATINSESFSGTLISDWQNGLEDTYSSDQIPDPEYNEYFIMFNKSLKEKGFKPNDIAKHMEQHPYFKLKPERLKELLDNEYT